MKNHKVSKLLSFSVYILKGNMSLLKIPEKITNYLHLFIVFLRSVNNFDIF